MIFSKSFRQIEARALVLQLPGPGGASLISFKSQLVTDQLYEQGGVT